MRYVVVPRKYLQISHGRCCIDVSCRENCIQDKFMPGRRCCIIACMAWHVIFYMDEHGNEPVKDFILGEPDKAIAEILHVFDLLYKFDLSLGLPYVEKIDGKIWSLRIKHSSDYYRIFYFAFSNKKFILLHAIKKKSDKLSNSDIELAIKRMHEHKTKNSG